MRRIKRFISHELPGASLKDTSYSRGKNRVIDYLTDYGKDTTPETIMQRYRNLYIGKL
ncbi:MAG: hypothetical protein LBG59_06080 [Candidatus Peribacteria bacterium]|nr:hypothetical protein [Candidatus Peribacteria bacterium]